MSSLTDEVATLLGQVEARVRAALGRLGVPELQTHAEDIAQEARLRFWRAMQAESSPSFPASYLHKVVVSACIDAVRAFHARPDRSRVESVGSVGEADLLDALPSNEHGPEEHVHDQNLLDQLRRRLQDLPVDVRRMVLLHAQGFTTAEIAQLTGNSEPAVRNRLYRALPGLREGLLLRSDIDGQ